MRRPSALRRQTASQDGPTPSQGNVVGVRVREVRLRRALTLVQVCERIGLQSGYELHQSTLTRIEQGSRSVYDFEVIALSRALEVDARVLLGLIENE